MNAGQISALLACRHSKDVYVGELTLGPAYGSGATRLRLDGWAMSRSWASYRTFGYEIKAKRNDWLRDHKWEGYREFVHVMNLVCPWGLIKPEEVPDGTGLIWVTNTGTRLITKRKPTTKDPGDTNLALVLSGVMINRFQTGDDRPTVDSREYWTKWLAEKREDRELGFAVSRAIREKVVDMTYKVKRMEKKVAEVEEYRAIIDALGLWSGSDAATVQKEAHKRFVLGLPKGLSDWRLKTMVEGLTELREMIKEGEVEP